MKNVTISYLEWLDLYKSLLIDRILPNTARIPPSPIQMRIYKEIYDEDS